MKGKFLGILVLSAFVLGLPSIARGQTLTILHANDTHSALFPFGPQGTVGGIARMSALIRSLKAKNDHVLTLHAGDVFVGSFEFNEYLGYPELQIMQKLYDAMELGNHEFDLGVDTLTGILTGVIPGGPPISLPILCANIDLSSHPTLGSIVKPYLIKNLGKFKIGLIGVLNTDAQNYSPEVAALLTDPYQAAGLQAATLRAMGCNIVICVSHLGQMYDVLGLSQVPGIDIIVGGHSHDVLKKPVLAGGKIIVQAGAYGMYLGELKVALNGSTVVLQSYTLHRIDKTIPKDPKLAGTIAALRTGILQDPRFGNVLTARVATADRLMTDSWIPGNPYRDTPLGNLVADAIKTGVINSGYSIDIGLEVMGYTAFQLYKGKIVGNDILRCVPYGYDPTSGLDFKIDIIEIDGGTLLALLEYSVSIVEYADDLSLEPSGLTFQYDSSQPASTTLGVLSRIDPTSVMIHGQPINPTAHYRIALNEQIYKTLEGLGVTPYSVTETGLLEYNLVRDFVQGLNHVDYQAEGRVIDTAIK